MAKELKSWRRVRLSLVRETADQPYTLRTPDDVARLLRAFIGDDPRERVVAAYLDTKHRPITVHEVAIGVADASHMHPREVFGPAVALAATALVVAHNHPSGDPAPSAEDRKITERLSQAGELLGIPLLDHIIFGAEGRQFSFSAEREIAL